MGKRKEAKTLGLIKYISDTPCKKCGTFEKYVSSYGCVHCAVESGLKKLANPELMAPYRTKEKQREKQKRWRENNYDKWQAQWLRPEHKAKRNAKASKRRAFVRNQTPQEVDHELIIMIYEECVRVSKETGIPHEVDHIIPICKGGLHHQDNLQIIPRKENRVKGGRL